MSAFNGQRSRFKVQRSTINCPHRALTAYNRRSRESGVQCNGPFDVRRSAQRAHSSQPSLPRKRESSVTSHSTFNVQRSAFGDRRSAFDGQRSAFGSRGAGLTFAAFEVRLGEGPRQGWSLRDHFPCGKLRP